VYFKAKTMEEIWKDVKGFEGLYQVSNIGRIKSLRKGLILKSSINAAGYRHNTFSVNGSFKTLHLHRMLAIAFIENPNKYLVVNHKDGNKTNNNLDNLEWVTYSENTRHGYRIGLMKNPTKGTSVATSRLNNSQVLEIRDKYIPYKNPMNKIALEYNVCERTILDIITRATWKHI
jgi:hypothetical protein